MKDQIRDEEGGAADVDLSCSDFSYLQMDVRCRKNDALPFRVPEEIKIRSTL